MVDDLIAGLEEDKVVVRALNDLSKLLLITIIIMSDRKIDLHCDPFCLKRLESNDVVQLFPVNPVP